ncbi:MAG: hypothetical protein H6772_03225 [Pseudomonadales bacterium]|nr:hypothetical protein [Pseudomonadales bacterium]
MLSSTIWNIIIEYKKILRDQYSIKKFLKLILLFLFSIIIVFEYNLSFKYTDLEINDWALLQSYNQPDVNIENSILYNDFTSVIYVIKKLNIDKAIYFNKDINKSYMDQGIFYFSQADGIVANKSELSKLIQKDQVYIWERDFDEQEEKILEKFIKLYSNDTFYLLKLEHL